MVEWLENEVRPAKFMIMGGTTYLCVTREMKDYLNIKDDELSKVRIAIKADKGKHGRFFGFGVQDTSGLSEVEQS